MEHGQEIAGQEGFFSRLFGTFFNGYRNVVNYVHALANDLRATFKQDWIQYAGAYIQRLGQNPPSDEQFSGVVGWSGTKQQWEQAAACLDSCCKCLMNIEKNILAPDKAVLTGEMQQAIQRLVHNHCHFDPEKPNKCKAAKRTAYGTMGRAGLLGYGSDWNIYFSHLKKHFDQIVAWYKVMTMNPGIAEAFDKAQSTIESQLQKMTSSNQEAVSARVEIMQKRMIAYRGLLKVTYDLWDMVAIMNVFIPAETAARVAGKKDSLTSWILSTKKDD